MEQGSSSENGPSSQAINNLSGVTITNANLTASEIPANIVASNYLPLSGGMLTGTLNVPTLSASSTSFGVLTTINASSTNLPNFGSAYFGGTATSTFDSAGDLTVAGLATLSNGFISQASSTVVGNLAVTNNLSSANLQTSATQGNTYVGPQAASSSNVAVENTAVGDSYSDLGAAISAPQVDLNLGIRTYLNGTLDPNIVIDTSSVATDTIDYVVTDPTGITATSTRTVMVEAAPSLEGTVTGAGNTATSTSPAQTSTTTPTVTAASSTNATATSTAQ